MNSDANDEFKRLCDTYNATLPDKITQIENQFQKLKEVWDTQNLYEFSSLIHKLAGSAGTYGHKNISEEAEKVEVLLSRYDYDIPADEEAFNEISKQILTIKNLINTNEAKQNTITLTKVETNLVYLLNDDNATQSMAENSPAKLKTQLATFGYELMIFNDIEKFFKAVQEKTPIVLLVNFDLISNPFMINLNNRDLYDIISLYFNKIYTIFIANSGEFEKRLKAVRMGARSYLLTPFNLDELIIELDNLKYLWNGKFRAIIVDDDQDILQYYANLLMQANIEIKPLTTCKQLDNELHHFKPDIILLDLNMPECNGMETAAIIRQQKTYADIPIVFFSTEENKHVQLKAMSMGGDDFISKSTDPDHLIQTIRNKASRYRNIRTILEKDNLTGAFNFRYMSREIEKLIEIYHATAANFLVGIIKIDNFNMIKENYGYAANDQILKSLYVLLSNQLANTRIIGYYAMDKFLIIFPNATIKDAQIELKKIQEKFHATLQYAQGKAYAASFSVGFAVYQDNTKIDALIKMAENDLTQADIRSNVDA